MSNPEKKQRAWEPGDYWHIGPVYVRKEFALLTVIGASAAVLMAFGLPLPEPGVPEDETPSYRWNDPALAGAVGEVQVLDGRGRVRYIGEVAAGAFTGQGKVLDEAGELLYEGPLADGVYEGPGAKVYQDGALVYTGEMAGNRYEGEGRRIDPETGVVSEGQFSGGCLEGQGQEFTADGTLLREGTFSRDRLEGGGAEYSREGVLLREGTFSAGLLHGEGREYTGSGKLRYEGQFRKGYYHGQGTLYNTLLGVPAASGGFAYGKLNGQGTLYHPSGQPLYEGLVYGEEPRADAFLGLSLAEVEAAFAPHWLLYACGDATAFVYPYFHLMFMTESPVALESSAEEDPPQPEAAASEEDVARQETASNVKNRQAPEPPVSGGEEQLSSDTDKRSIIITEVLSYGQPLPCVAQPSYGEASGQHRLGWREWFSGFASGGTARGAGVRQTGQFVWRFTPLPGAGVPVDEFRAESAGVETMTVRKEDKDMSLWYQTAKWGEGP